MAHSKDNLITRTYSGKLDNFCMQSDGILRRLPDMSNRILSKKQEQQISRFESAKEYARQVVADAEKSAFYARFLKRWKKKNKKKNVGVYHLAISDFTHPPKIYDIELSDDNIITFLTHEEFGITGASVSLVAPDGAILEEGEAIYPLYAVYLQYIVKDPSLLQRGITIRVRAWGRPGVAAEKDFPLFAEHRRHL